jgi:hypothetical protein
VRGSYYRERNETRSERHDSRTASHKPEGEVCGMGGSLESRSHGQSDGITLDWLQSIHASLCGNPAIEIEDSYCMEIRLAYLSGLFAIPLVKGICFFDAMESYLLRAVNGKIYLWYNEQDLLYYLGRSRKDIASALQTKADGWGNIPSIEPGYLRAKS